MTGCVDEGALEFMWVSCGGTTDKQRWELLLNVTGPDLQLLCPELRYKMSLCVLYDHPGVGSVWGRRGDNHRLCWACRHSSYPHRQCCYRCLAGEIHSSSYISLCKVYIHMSDIVSFHKVSPWLQRLMMPNKTMQSKYFIISSLLCICVLCSKWHHVLTSVRPNSILQQDEAVNTGGNGLCVKSKHKQTRELMKKCPLGSFVLKRKQESWCIALFWHSLSSG